MTQMLQKSENVTNNVANENSQDLTEQWKQKKLPLGWYFVKNEDGKIDYAEYMEWFNADGWCGNYFECEEKIVEVLAEAPDYIDWRNMVNCACEEHEANKRFIEENKRLKHDVGNLGYKIKNQRHEIDNRLKEIKQLKELLKECRLAIFDYPPYDLASDKIRLTIKIDEVLNETNNSNQKSTKEG